MAEKESIKVVIRTRPTPDFASKNINIDPSTQQVTVAMAKDDSAGVINNQKEQWTFKFDKLLHNASQEEVFEYCAQQAVRKVVDGFNGTIMCYGQTGAGKTFTMNGSTANYKYRGLIPRAINKIFSEVGGRFDNQITVRVSFVEIYNELMFDMLSDKSPAEQSGTGISIQDDASGEVSVRGLTMSTCSNEEEALNCLFEGEQQRATTDNNLNANSSRSHAIFTIHIESRSTIEQSEKVITSKLHLVDLAGNERTKKTGATGITMREANYINRSLSFLEQVVVGSTDKKRDHVPYRQSKLTNMLKSSIGGNCYTILIANIWPEAHHLEETLSTLRFATRMKQVENAPKVNETADQALLIKRYQKEVRDLKQELAMHDTLANPGVVSTEPYTAEQAYDIQKVASDYLTGKVDDIEDLSSVRQVNEFLAQMRNLFQKLKQDGASMQMFDNEIGSEKVATADDSLKRRNTILEGRVGELEEAGEFGLGVAVREAKPVSKIEISKEKEAEIAAMQQWEMPEETQDELILKQEEDAMLTRMRRNQSRNTERRPAIDKQSAFKEFKSTEAAAEIEKEIIECRQRIKSKRGELATKTETVNAIKNEIDQVKGFLDVKADEKTRNALTQSMNPGFTSHTDGFEDPAGENAEIIDEEELQRLRELKDLKKQYRSTYSELRELQKETKYTQQAIDNQKQKLINAFEEWYCDTFEESNQSAAHEQSMQQSASGQVGQQTGSRLSNYKNVAPGQMIRDPEMDADEEQAEADRKRLDDDGNEGVDVDPDAAAYIRSRQDVLKLRQARKNN